MKLGDTIYELTANMLTLELDNRGVAKISPEARVEVGLEITRSVGALNGYTPPEPKKIK